MSKDKTVVDEIHELQNKRFKEALRHWPVVELAHGLWVFAEGVALMVTSLYAIYQAHYGHLPIWGRYGLTVAGALVLVPAAAILGKFFRNVGKS